MTAREKIEKEAKQRQGSVCLQFAHWPRSFEPRPERAEGLTTHVRRRDVAGREEGAHTQVLMSERTCRFLDCVDGASLIRGNTVGSELKMQLRVQPIAQLWSICLTSTRQLGPMSSSEQYLWVNLLCDLSHHSVLISCLNKMTSIAGWHYPPFESFCKKSDYFKKELKWYLVHSKF